MIENNITLRDWMFRSLMFEADSESFRNAGIRIGSYIEQESEFRLIEEIIDPFPIDLRNSALRMSRLYTLIYCFENSLRDLIKDRLQDSKGTDWWQNAVPKRVKEHADKRFEKAKKESWITGQQSELLSFIDFGHLSDIIIYNWEQFSDLIPTQHWLKQRLDDLEQARNYIAHNRLLMPAEFRRIEEYINDWNKIVGL